MPIAVKICGLSTAEAVDVACRNGAAMVGFVFFRPSPRSVAPEAARMLAARVPDGVVRVGVVVDPDDALLDRLVEVVPLDLLQLHGHESAARVAEVRRRTGLPVMKAIRVAGPGDLASVAEHATVADRLLFDAKPPKGHPVPGGHGLAFDWQLLEGVALDRPWLLGGGLHAGNLDAAVTLSGARGVDVSSGVEAAPGVKDVHKIEAFLRRAARLEPRPGRTPAEVPA